VFLRSLQRRLPLLIAITMVLIAIAFYVFGLALLQSIWHKHYHFQELILPRLIDVTVFLWLFWVGSSIGSFLNVVAWRMPLGKSINGRSFCPRCQTQLSARDNFPVFGWIALGGRCRTCRLPISRRYPMVEAIVGTCVTLVGIAELYHLSLPLAGSSGYHGPIWAPRVSAAHLSVLLYHVVAISTLFACGLIRVDGKPLPLKLVLFTAATTIIPLLAYPPLAIVPWQVASSAARIAENGYLSVLVRILCSLVAAAFFARSLGRSLCPTADPKFDPLGSGTRKLLDTIVLLSVPSLVVGWQSLPAVILVAAFVALMVRRLTGRGALESLAISLPIAMTFQLATWRRLHQSDYWPSFEASPWVILAYAAAAMTIPLWLSDSQPPPATVATATESINVDTEELESELGSGEHE
jgi:leader peptidase (prepilin peptidase) / N-methyltransferase